MDIMELGAIGELVGGVAVIGSLIYLALQVRGGAQEQRASSMREAAREMGAVVQAVGETEERAGIWLKGMLEFEAMDALERLRFSVMLGHFFRLLEQLYYQSRDGNVESESWRGFVRQMHDIVGYTMLRIAFLAMHGDNIEIDV